jgi:hypothetical protein
MNALGGKIIDYIPHKIRVAIQRGDEGFEQEINKKSTKNEASP